MKVRFLQDYQGQHTGPHFYREGQEVELPDSTAARLIADERVVEVKPKATPKAAPKRRVSRKQVAPKKASE